MQMQVHEIFNVAMADVRSPANMTHAMINTDTFPHRSLCLRRGHTNPASLEGAAHSINSIELVDVYRNACWRRGWPSATPSYSHSIVLGGFELIS